LTIGQKITKERAGNSKKLFWQKQVNLAILWNTPTDQHFHLLKLKKSQILLYYSNYDWAQAIKIFISKIIKSKVTQYKVCKCKPKSVNIPA